MHSETIRCKQRWAWLSVAMSAPIAHFSGGAWPALLVLGVVCYGVSELVPDNMGGIGTSRILCALELVWLLLLLSSLMPLSSAYWPGPKSEIVIPVLLLALGAYSCGKRPSAVAGVLFWVIIIMYVPVAVAGAKDVTLRWLVPKSIGINLWMVPVLLLPCAAKLLPCESKGHSWYPGILASGAALWALTAGVLSPQIAENLSEPFRELSRSLTIGAASRFESLISVAVTLGWFCFGSLLIRCSCVLCDGLGISGKIAPWLVAAAAAGLQWLNVQISPENAAIFTLVLWVAVPTLWRKFFRKKSKKAIDKKG